MVATAGSSWRPLASSLGCNEDHGVVRIKHESSPSHSCTSINTGSTTTTQLPVFADLLRASHLAANSLSPTRPTPLPSLSFLLEGNRHTPAPPVGSDQDDCYHNRQSFSSSTTSTLSSTVSPRTSPKCESSKRKERPASRTCKFDGCAQYVVDHGLCVRHGGGKRCTMEDCTSRAKHYGRCWRHGGSMECKISDCMNRAKSRGYCWSHGGGTKCKADECEKIAISNGLCWAHGGGKRCGVTGCMKQAYERTENLCNSHFRQIKREREFASQSQVHPTEEDSAKRQKTIA